MASSANPPPKTSALDFNLKIQPAGEGQYWVNAQSSSGEASAVFSLPFDPKDLEIFLLKVNRPRKIASRGRVPEPLQETVEFGSKLYAALFQGEVRDLFNSTRQEARRNAAGLRLRLRLADAPDLGNLPWEFLYDGLRFLVLDEETPLVRYLDLPEPTRPLRSHLPLRILVTTSTPLDWPPLDISAERERLSTALSELVERGLVELDFDQEASLKGLQRALRQAHQQGRPYHIWHYIGHGSYDQNQDHNVLLLTDDQGISHPVNGFQLGTLFDSYQETRLVILNACEGARSSREDPFAGVAAALVERGVPAVAAMQFEISDEAAITFSGEFYAALAEGLPVDSALTVARRAVFFLPNWVEWATPVLFMRSPDGVLFDLESGAAVQSKPEASARADETSPQTEAPARQVQPPLPDKPAEFSFTAPEEIHLGVTERVEIRNDSDQPRVFSLEFGGDQQLFILPYADFDIPLEPGESQSIPFEVNLRKKPIFGDPKRHTIQIAAGGWLNRRTAQAEIEVKPQFPIWSIPLVAAGLIILVAIASSIWNGVRDSNLAEQTQTAAAALTSQAIARTTQVASTHTPGVLQSATLASGSGTQAVPVSSPTAGFTLTPTPTPVPTILGGGSGRIVYSIGYALYLIDITQGDSLQLTADNQYDRSPAWSPDGARLAFTRERILNNRSDDEIYVINANGSGLLQVSNTSANDSNPVWSPDGESLLYVSNRTGPFELYLENIFSPEFTQLTAGQGTASQYAWSPDGSRIAYIAGDSMVLISVDANIQIQTPLTSSYLRLYWTPDSRLLVYDGGMVRIYDLQGNELTSLQAPGAADGYTFAFSPDGSRLVYPQEPEPAIGPVLYTLDLASGQAVSIAPSLGALRALSWAPDGTHLAVQTQNQDLYLVPVESGEIRRVAAKVSAFAWSPDARMLAFVQSGDNGYELDLINADGSGQRYILQGTDYIDSIFWQP